MKKLYSWIVVLGFISTLTYAGVGVNVSTSAWHAGEGGSGEYKSSDGHFWVKNIGDDWAKISIKATTTTPNGWQLTEEPDTDTFSLKWGDGTSWNSIMTEISTLVTPLAGGEKFIFDLAFHSPTSLSDLTLTTIQETVVTLSAEIAVVERFIDHGDGTVTDSITGLMWTKSASRGPMTWYDAMNYIDSLNNNQYLGYDDWRLPRVNRYYRTSQNAISEEKHPAELELIGRINADLNEDWDRIMLSEVFTDLQWSRSHWSATTWMYNPDSAHYVYFPSGGVYYRSKTYEDNYVWPVRSGQ